MGRGAWCLQGCSPQGLLDMPRVSACMHTDLLKRIPNWKQPICLSTGEWTDCIGFPDGSVGKESTCNAGDLGWGDPLEKEKPPTSSILACIVHGIAKSQTGLSGFHFHFKQCNILHNKNDLLI